MIHRIAIAIAGVLVLFPTSARSLGSDDPARDDVFTVKGVLATGHLHVRQEAATFEAMVEQVRPRFTWNERTHDGVSPTRDLLWVTHDAAGKPTFTMNRAYRLQPARGEPARTYLFEADPECISDVVWYARAVDEKPTILARDLTRGVVYRAIWHSVTNSGNGRVHKTRQLFLLCDAQHRWHFIGEGPEAVTGKNGIADAYRCKVDATVRWTDALSDPVEIHCTQVQTHECPYETGLKPNVEELSTRRDCTLAGSMPSNLAWQDGVYVVIEKDEPIEALARRVAGWRTDYILENDPERRRKLVDAVADIIRSANPGIGAVLPAGTVVRFGDDIGHVVTQRVPPKRHAGPATPVEEKHH